MLGDDMRWRRRDQSESDPGSFGPRCRYCSRQPDYKRSSLASKLMLPNQSSEGEGRCPVGSRTSTISDHSLRVRQRTFSKAMAHKVSVQRAE